MRSSTNPHAFMGVTELGIASIVKTRGNQDVHVILRGGTSGPNFSSVHVCEAANVIAKALPRRRPSIMIDCSRGCLRFSYGSCITCRDDNDRWQLAKGP